jgi:CRISPR-associated endonuclease Cas1
VVVLTGYGVQIAVKRGDLVVEDGIAGRRRRQRFSRVDSDLKRLVIIGHSGHITLDAIAWLQGLGVPLIHLDYMGRLYFVSSPVARTVAQLRRFQAQAAGTARGFALAQSLLLAKLTGQVGLLDQLPDGEAARGPLTDQLDRTHRAKTLLELRDCEARAARIYWPAWRALPVTFVPADRERRPRHWRTFGTRISPLGGQGARRAVNPANAVLNYLYAMLEAEAVIATLAMRLDPALGVLHADREERHSFACDVMEPIRPMVDAFALSLFRDRTFTKEDVIELATGQCRLLPPVTRELALTARLWSARVMDAADYGAQALVPHRREQRMIMPGVPMPRATTRRRPKPRNTLVRAFEGDQELSWSGLVNPDSTWKGFWALRRHREADRAWTAEYGKADRQMYLREILPHLAGVPLWRITGATGMSRQMASQYRRGLRIPHPRLWEGLRAAIDGGGQSDQGSAPRRTTAASP